MIHIFYSYIRYQRRGNDLVFYLDMVPDEIKKKILRYSRWQDAHNSLFGKVLLQFGLNRLGLSNFQLKDLKYSPYHKPYFEGKVSFNISHSGSIIICVVSDECRVGVDIEEVAPIEVNDFKCQCTNNEWDQITCAENQYEQFYKHWTKKEAIAKASGKGLFIPLSHIEIEGDIGFYQKEVWFLEELLIDTRYVAHLATDKKIVNSLTIEQVEFLH